MLPEEVVLLGGGQGGVTVGGPDHTELVGIDAELVLEFEPDLQGRASILASEHVVGLRLAQKRRRKSGPGAATNNWTRLRAARNQGALPETRRSDFTGRRETARARAERCFNKAEPPRHASTTSMARTRLPEAQEDDRAARAPAQSFSLDGAADEPLR